MHERCQCCSDCQDELQSLRLRFQSLLIDYTCIRDRNQRQYTAHQICLDENMLLNRKMIDQKIEIQRLQTLIQKSKVNTVGEGFKNDDGDKGNERDRRERMRIEDLNKVIDAKNRELSYTKYQFSQKNNQLIQTNLQNETLRRNVEQLNKSLRINLNKVAVEKAIDIKTQQKQQILTVPLQSNQKCDKSRQIKHINFEEDRFNSLSSPLNITFPSTKSKEAILPNYLLKPDSNNSTTAYTKSIESSIQYRIDRLQQQNDMMRNELSMTI